MLLISIGRQDILEDTLTNTHCCLPMPTLAHAEKPVGTYQSVGSDRAGLWGFYTALFYWPSSLYPSVHQGLYPEGVYGISVRDTVFWEMSITGEDTWEEMTCCSRWKSSQLDDQPYELNLHLRDLFGLLLTYIYHYRQGNFETSEEIVDCVSVKVSVWVCLRKGKRKSYFGRRAW